MTGAARPKADTRRRGAGPRGELDREAFVGRVVAAAEAIARVEGLRGLGMRRLAAAIGYAPNSIYHAVGDLDQVVLRVNARTLERLHDALSAALALHRDPREAALAMAEAYLAFVAREPRLWGLVSEHALPPGAAFPDWYEAALAGTTGLVDAALGPLIPDAEERQRAVAALWASLHGLASLSASGKLAVLTPEPPERLGRLLVARFLDGTGREA
ncbi:MULTISPECIES: TetR-like C-terminal domain-containing protein [Methylobacterium]|uniref:HTH-type transcriptional regulator MT1864/Rv1816-like C-terminal domain-containing protein n=2 Tax=Pseudomonadota TaxID=1224 RepID=A0ABQ4SPS3_9HYPH|nr:MULTISPECIES: TetR-like C-terminal domain-containing protein [Methylobacterium]PIU06199.1 MAG: TetR family transcriptional regulator [Methylobacterium sp. CG09_land_8_20_14_0_10_71_15]PIU14490.1 MAG: TetR family transcriptional regulator [Methylobacterium sp. CG08_land_8_20_14_0_20_71_15]GBU18254.1 hypothetical protein AwMethylo_24690 [Methylobacterium sp.]GJE05175.1 hypothetical protein AOPFMNJM_0472 [Methylobacterium jeotgali]